MSFSPSGHQQFDAHDQDNPDKQPLYPNIADPVGVIKYS
jgi:hypothetical protein